MPFRTRGLVRRATPFAGIAAVFAVAIAFPLFLLAVLSVALFDNSAQLIGIGIVAALAILILSITQLGPTSNLATAVFEVAVLGIVAAAVHEVVEHARLAEGSAEQKAIELESIDERLRMTLEAAMIGLGLVTASGRWVQVNEKLVAILGRGREELMQMGLLEVTSNADRGVVEDALGKLGRREIVRWAGGSPLRWRSSRSVTTSPASRCCWSRRRTSRRASASTACETRW